MSEWEETHLPCPCGKSSDAYSVAKDGHGFCFSCKRVFGQEQHLETVTTVTGPAASYEYLPRREINKETHEFFGARTRIGADGKPLCVEYHYPNGAVQCRRVDKKEFWSEGPMSQAGGGGTNLFPAGSSKSITVVEGADDAMAAWQMLGKYPVYWVKSASSAASDIRKDFDYLNSFEKIYLALDSDEPGQSATKEVAAIFGYGKIYHVKLAPFKDPHDFLEQKKVTEFRNCWWNAVRFVPEGIVSSWSEIDRILDEASKEPGLSWPFPTLTKLTKGIQRGRAYLFSGLEGIGKTTLFHAVEAHIADEDPEANFAIIHLEEPVDETVENLASYELGVNVVQADGAVSKQEVKDAYRALSKRSDRVHILGHYGSDDPDVLLSKIRFLVAACGCKYVFLDNITIIATGRKQDDERKELDYLSTRLEMLVKELKFTLICISHENDHQQTRGSHNITKVFDVWINMVRDIKNPNEHLRKIIYLTLFKGRGCRGTGPAGRLMFDEYTGQLSELSEELPS